MDTHEHSSMNPKDLAMSNLIMFTIDEVAECLGTTRQKISDLIECGLLTTIKIGKRHMITQYEISNFQHQYAGANLSNKFEMLKTVNNLNNTGGTV